MVGTCAPRSGRYPQTRGFVVNAQTTTVLWGCVQEERHNEHARAHPEYLGHLAVPCVVAAEPRLEPGGWLSR
jgi:hypothetical protein